MTYKGYYLYNFDGHFDEFYKGVVDNGKVLRHSGNWDLIAVDGIIYAIATVKGCRCSCWGDGVHYWRIFRENIA